MVFDWICAGIAFFWVVLGLFRGLIRQLFGVVGFLGGLVLAHLFAEPLAIQMGPSLGLSPALGTIAFSIAIFFLIEVVATLSGNFLHDHLGTILGTLDRLGGAVLGLAKGLLFVWVLASLAALLHAHLSVAERTVGPIAKLDLEHSQVLHSLGRISFLGDVNEQIKQSTRPAHH